MLPHNKSNTVNFFTTIFYSQNRNRMKGLKLSSFMIFLIILIVLVILVALYNYFSSGKNWLNKEGFIQLYNDTQINDTVILPMYSPDNGVLKLYDNLFFDNKNGNLIEIVDESASSNSIVALKFHVTTRTGVTTIYNNDASVTVKESLIASMKSSYVSWVYNTFCTATNTYSVAYMPWGTSTYIHIIDTTQPTSMQTYLFTENGNMNHSQVTIPAFLTGPANDTDANNNTMVTDTAYNPTHQVYQISKYVKYDLSNGNLVADLSSGIIVYDKQSNSTTYDSNKTKISSRTGSVGSGPFSPWATVDTNGQTLVVYIPGTAQTTIASLRKGNSANGNVLTLGNVSRFGVNGLDNGNGTANLLQLALPSYSREQTGTGATGTGEAGIHISFDNSGMSMTASNAAIFNYLTTFMQYGPQGGDMNPFAVPTLQSGSDYILKTQIVPPVCPSCPGCAASAGTVCSNCGGQGGSGTLTCNGASVIDASGNIVLDKNGKPTACSAPAGTSVSISNNGIAQSGTAGGVANNLINTTGNVITNTESTAANLLQGAGTGTSNLLQNAGTGTTDLLQKTASGTTNVLSNTLSGTKDFAKETASGIKDFAKETGSGVKGLIEDTGAGLSKFLTANATRVNNSGGASYYGSQNNGATGSYGQQSRVGANYGTNTQYTDPYSYSGMLPAKSPSNYMPITADFSSFGK